MIRLSETSPTVEQGCFLVRETQRVYSELSIDHAHEQNNKQVEGNGRAVGYVDNSPQLIRWMVSGPEVSRVIDDFESALNATRNIQKKGPEVLHHELVNSVQRNFQAQVKTLTEVI